jgi:hypothetical protein
VGVQSAWAGEDRVKPGHVNAWLVDSGNFYALSSSKSTMRPDASEVR